MSSQFKYQFSEILSLITTAGKQELITDDEKKEIKNFVISKEPNLKTELDEYNEDKNLIKFIESLKVACGLTDMSSPVDNNLILRKRRKAKTTKLDQLKEDKVNIEDCDLGMSPTVNFHKLFNK